jgi:hypothetical protein
MLLLRLLKGGQLRAVVMHPHGEDDPDPHIGKRSYRHRMAFAFRSFALRILPGPGFTLGRLPGEVMQGLAQRFTTRHSAMRLGIHPALQEHGRGSAQRLQEAFIEVSLALIADLGKPPRGQALACTRQACKELMVLMGQKKGVNLLVILRNLLNQRQQLAHQHQHQTRFGARGDGIGLHMWLVQPLENRGGDRDRIGMLRSSEDLCERFSRSGHRSLWSRVGLQEQQGALLLQFGKQLQSQRVVGYASGGELIDQTRLHADQRILIAREQFQFGNFLTIWAQAVQIGQVSTSCLGQHIGSNRIGRGLQMRIADDRRCED